MHHAPFDARISRLRKVTIVSVTSPLRLRLRLAINVRYWLTISLVTEADDTAFGGDLRFYPNGLRQALSS